MEPKRLRLRSNASQKEIENAICVVENKNRRFRSLGDQLKKGLNEGNFIYLESYLRLVGWFYSGRSYEKAKQSVRGLCVLLFGYKIPEEINSLALKNYRYGRHHEEIEKLVECHNNDNLK